MNYRELSRPFPFPIADRATPFRMTMTAFQSPLRIIFYRSLLSRTCDSHSGASGFATLDWPKLIKYLELSAKSKHDTWGVYYKVVFFGWAVFCCLVNCWVFAAPLPSGLDSRSRKRCSNNMASTSKRVARKDTNSIRSHQHLCAVLLLSGCLAVCGYLCRRLCVTASLLQVGLSLDCLFGMCNAVIQTAPMHSASVPSLALLSWGNEMGLVGNPRFSDAVACGGQRLTRAEYPKIKALRNTNRQMLRWMIDLNTCTSRVGLHLETQAGAHADHVSGFETSTFAPLRCVLLEISEIHSAASGNTRHPSCQKLRFLDNHHRCSWNYTCA